MNRLNFDKKKMMPCTTYGFRCLHFQELGGWWCSACGCVEYVPVMDEREQQAEEIQRDTEWLGEVTK